MKCVSKISFIIFSLFIGVSSYAQLQGQAKLDSLLEAVTGLEDDTIKVKVLQTISWSYLLIDVEKGLEYGKQCLELSEKLDWKRGIAIANYSLGGNSDAKGDYPSALAYYLKALTLFQESGNMKGVANVTGAIGNIYSSRREYKEALEYFLKSEDMYKRINNKMGLARTYANIGTVYSDGLKDYPKALEFMMKSLVQSEEIDDKLSLAINLGNIGFVYSRLKDYESANAYYESSLAVAKEIGEKGIVSYGFYNLGTLYLSYIESVKSGQLRETDNKVGAGVGHKYLPPKVSLPSDRHTLLSIAFSYLRRSITIAREVGDLERVSACHEALSNAYRLDGNYQKALEESDLYHAIRDSMFSAENKQQILKLSLKNEYERKHLADSMKVAQAQNIAAIDLKRQKSYTYMGVTGIVLLIGFSFFIARERGKSEAARKKSEDLLLNILPEEVASELKSTGTTTAKHYNDVTVLFTDFVDFTKAGEHFSPQELINELHTCFRVFDEITSKYGIEKIKTIGDAYLAVAGLPVADYNHAENVLKAAIEIRDFVERRYARLGRNKTFEVRIGIHSGSVIAGVVGVKKFAYDIWGDTVNTAARMEQNSEAGKINVSQTTYNLIKHRFPCEYRGELAAKNKGMMKMYFVV